MGELGVWLWLLSDADEDELPGEVLLPLLLPPGENEPPVADPGCTPKYEKTLWRQLGCVKSGQLLWVNEGALSSLLLSPVNTNDISSLPADALVLEDAAALLPYPSAPEGRISCQGIATSFSEPEVVEMELVVDPGVDCEEADELELAPVVLELLPLLDEPE